MREIQTYASFADAASVNTTEIMSRLGTRAGQGLSRAEASDRLVRYGGNDLERQKNGAWVILKRQVASPFIFLLFAAAAIALATGEAIDAAMIVLFMCINTGLGFTQEYHAEKAVRTLLEYWHAKAHVIRDGIATLVETHELVPGDMVRLQAGDKVPADVRIISSHGLVIDESVLTGESVDVSKSAATLASKPDDWYAATNIAFSGTSIVAGEADAVVFATGKHAAIGEIASLARETKMVSAYEKDIASFSVFIMKLVSVTLVLMFALNVGLKGLDRVQELILFSIALTVGVIPEALPVVSTIALSRGALRMAQKRVIVKRLSAIDDLGSIDILCTDKTGTITENSLHVADVYAKDEEACLLHGLLGSSYLGEKERQQNNSFDVALWQHASAGMRRTAMGAKKLTEVPFDPVHRFNATLVSMPGDGTVAVLRGAADEVMPRCDHPADELAAGKWLGERGLAGNRVIAVAIKDSANEATLDDKSGWRFLGFIAFHDPIKQSSFAAVKKAHLLGVRIKILTGDSREVAGAVAAKLGITESPLDVITGAEFVALSNEAQHEALERFHVFARMNPKQKFTVLGLLQEKYAVGFLGEGFNDAPGLKLANVGLAVDGASDISKEAADVILQGKSLSVIFDGIEEGRRTYANVNKYLKVTLASNFGNFYAVAVSSFFIPFLPMLPLQILLLNLLTDFPMITIATDTVDVSELQKPSKYDARHFIFVATVLGIVSSAFDFATFAAFRPLGESGLQSMWFVVSVLTELALIHSLRTSRPFWKATRPPFVLSALTFVAGAGAIAIPFTPFGAEVFRFAPPTAAQLWLAFSIVAAYVVATETVKLWLHRMRRA